jgi:hypothetical protein
MGRYYPFKLLQLKCIAASLGVLTVAVGASAIQAQQAPPAASVPAGSVGGLGDVNLFPKRVVLAGRTRIATIGLYNKATGPGDYKITVDDRIMTEDGQLLDLDAVPDPAAKARVKSARAMLRWSPQRVTLRGSEAQTVRLMARVPPDLAPGEYRSHFSVTAIPPGAEGGFSVDEAVGGPQGNSIGVRIVPRFGITIPVIVRIGATTLEVGLKDFQLVRMENGATGAKFTITRSGTRSAFGNIVLTMGGAKKPLAELKGIGVYTEIDRRQVVIPIDPAALAAPIKPGSRITVTYTDDDAAPGQVLAKQEFSVP